METIDTYKNRVSDIMTSSFEASKEITSSINVMDLDAVGKELAEAVVVLEKFSDDTLLKKWISRMPFIGKFLQKSLDKITVDSIKTLNLSTSIERLFTTLEKKQDNIEEIVEALLSIRNTMAQNDETLSDIESDIKENMDVYNNGNSFKARNLLVMIGSTIISLRDKIGVIDVITQSAEIHTQQIGSMLPYMKSGIIDGLTITAGLNKLQEYKSMFDQTTSFIRNINTSNSQKINNVLLNVVELVSLGKDDILALKEITKTRVKFRDEFNNKMGLALKELDGNIRTISELQKVLPAFSERKLIE